MEQGHLDACVVGGGPAGAVAALRLAQLGHRVGLVERASFPRSHVGESLTSRVWTLLDVLGLRESFLKEDFLRSEEILVRWDNLETERLLAVENAAGLTVNRGKFDMLLLKAAETAGVRIIRPAQACVATWGESLWRLEVKADTESRCISAKYLVDATGRRSFMPGARLSTSPPTLALCGYLRAPARREPTRIEAVPDGWCWGASVPGKLLSTMVFVDPSTLRPRRTAGLEEFWRSQLAKAALFVGVSRLPLVQPIVAYDATTAFATDSIGTNFVRVGEASFSLDPLSSTGVEKAMQTGCNAAVVVHTMILRPDRRELCMRFYRERQRQTVSAHAGWSADFYSKVVRYGEFPFWRARSQSSAGGQLSPILLSSSPQDKSFSVMTRVQLSDKVQLVKEPCIVDDEVCERMALLYPTLDRPVAFIDGVELERLLTMVPRNVDIGTLLTLWSTRVPPQQAAKIAGWLIENGIFEFMS
jgi:2-polyprenyl-6-methoxyphenol hydroxylase-like FAD-dependent oxidoreductase